MGYLDKPGLARLWTHIIANLGEKVDKVDGKGLSTNDYTTVEKTKLANVSTTTQVNTRIDNKINALTIGGTNLFRTSQHPQRKYWSTLHLWTYDGTYQGCDVYKKLNAWSGLKQSVTLEASKKYTVSAWMKIDGGSVTYYDSLGSGQISSNRNGTGMNVGTEWARYSITITVSTAGAYAPRFEQTQANYNLWIAGLKLEEGEKATSWSPSPLDGEDTGDGINLFKGTRDFPTDKWTNIEKWTKDGTLNGMTVLKNIDNTYTWSGINQSVTLVVGQTYTMSAWLKQDEGGTIWFSSGANSNVAVGDVVASKLTQVGTDWTHVAVTFTAVKTNGSLLSFNEDISGKHMWIAGLKLERGETATAWSPAPEDPVLVSQSDCAVTATSTDGVAYTATVPGITELVDGVSFLMLPNKESDPTINSNSNIYCKLNVNGLGEHKIARVSSLGLEFQGPITLTPFLCYKITYISFIECWVVTGHNRPLASDIYGNVAIAHGGTGASTASGARTNLGITSGTELPTEGMSEGDIFFLYTATTTA